MDNGLRIALKNKSYDIANYLLMYGADPGSFFRHIQWNTIDNDEKFNSIIYTIEYLIKKMNQLLVTFICT